MTRDGVEVDQVVLHALAWYADHQNRKFDWVCILQVTSPLRTVSDVAESYRLLMQNPDADGVVSVSPYHHHPYWAFQIENGFVRPDRPDQVITSRRLLPPLYHPDGVIYWFRAANVLAGRPPYEGRILAYHTPPTSAVDIDEPEDFAYAEFLLNGRNQAANNSTTPS